MKNYDFILFDLDGTLTDPGEGITNSVAYALKKYGIVVGDKTTLYKFIGPPLIDSFMKYFGFPRTQAVEATEFYREYFAVAGIFENRVYPGIEELLKKLHSAGKKLILATSKPEEFAVAILEHFGIAQYFTYIAGSQMDGTRAYKDQVIAYALESAAVPSADSAIMVGDREYDIIGAKKLGMDSIGVLFGYGNREELEAAGATYIADSADDISAVLL